MITCDIIKHWLESKGFQFDRPYGGDAYTFNSQFLGYHEQVYFDYYRCLDKWLNQELGRKWYYILRDGEIPQIFDFVERENIKTAVTYLNWIASECEYEDFSPLELE